MMLRNQLVLVSACAAFAGAVAQNPWMGLAPCSLKDGVSIYVADQHDGDQKQILRQGTQISIYPFANNQTWVVTAELNVTTCAASINFNVPGKPSPPPVNLTATFWTLSQAVLEEKVAVGFTDPTATIANSGSYPVNYWIQIDV